MKKFTICLILFQAVLFQDLRAQNWFTEIPADANGRLNYLKAKEYVETFRGTNPGFPFIGEKQFLRAQFFLDGRIGDDGYLPSGIYWEEGKRVIAARNQGRPSQTSWSFIGPDNSTIGLTNGEVGGSGRIDCIEFHPADPDVFYVGAPCGGLWRTTDGGGSWEVLTDNLPTLGISDVDIHPQNPDIIYICTGTRDIWWETFSVGILKSEDGGQTWQETGLQYEIEQNRAVHELWIHPADPGIMLAATSIGLYRSEDGGDTWSRVVTGNFMDLAQKPGDPTVIYATNFNFYNCGARVYRSTDSGASFQPANTGIPLQSVNRITIGVTPANPDVVYALCSNCSDNGFYGLYRSNNNGDTWFKTPNSANKNLLGWLPSGYDPGGQGFFTLSLAVDPANPDHVYIGGVNIWETIDGGNIWTLNAQYYGAGAQYVHADIHTLTYNPLDQTLYNTNDGGIYRFETGNGDWVNISDGLHIMQFYRLGVWKYDEGKILGSPQDNGTVLFTDTVQYELLLAEACDNFFDYEDPDTMYFGGYAAGLKRSWNGGYLYQTITPPGESGYRFNPPFIMHPVNPEILYCAFKDVWRSDNRGNTWTNLTNGLSGSADYWSLEVAQSNQNYTYAATTNQIWMTANGGNDWINISTGLPGYLNISDIAISPDNPERIWVTIQGFAQGVKVFRSENGGVNWQNVSMNLPNMPANCITCEPGSDNAIYVGTDVGVYYTNDNLAEWVDYSEELPNVIIDELEIHPFSGKILAATYGRGMWENYLADPVTVGISTSVSRKVTIYPNPVSDKLWIECIPPSAGKFILELVTPDGRTVLQKEIRSTGMMIRSQVDVSGFATGLYYLRLTGEGINYTEKFIVGMNGM